MSAVTSDALARQWARQLEDREASRHGLTRAAARAKVARQVGTTPGTLENLDRGRLKGVREWLFSKLHAAVTRQVELEIAALTHEHAKLVALGRGRADGARQEVEAGLARLKALMKQDVSSRALSDGGDA